MPEPLPAERVCPYLRGRHQPAPLLAPSENNHCVLAASIHLPTAQQTRYCLGGRYARCPRFIRQSAAPLPLYVTGVPTTAPPPAPAVVPLDVLPWRRPSARRILSLAPFVLLLGLTVAGWFWRQNTLPAATVVRPPLPTPIAQPPQTESSVFLPPGIGPAQR